ncbi:MAG TPA: DUF1127 domain-containing protein [Alphaproteobacteria bacterium]|nr:DUF1127 domain-containing protein [Alphaproteobacteria bacterium]
MMTTTAKRDVVSAIRNALARRKQRKLIERFEAMSEHQLADIGLPRGMIAAVVETGASSLAQAEMILARRAAAARAEYEYLMSLNDHLLDDIGVTRGDLTDLLAGNDNRRALAA